MFITTWNHMNKFLFSFIGICLFFSFVNAASITQVKNGKALIALDNTAAEIGNEFFAINSSNKKVAILEITAVKNGKAIGKIIKGTTQTGDTITLKSKTSATTSKSSSFTETVPARSAKKVRFDQIKWGVTYKHLMDSITAKETDSSIPPLAEDVSMKGSSMGINAFMDYPMTSNFSVRGYAGYEILKVNGTAQYLSCDGTSSQNCNVNINYLSLGAIARYTFNLTSMQPWVGLGLQIKQPFSKSSTALDENNIQMAQSALVAGGLDYYLNAKYFIPLSFEYYYSLNTSPTVPTISQMALQIGLGLSY